MRAAGGSGHGLFIVFEGGEGAGKTTQVRRLTEWLERRGVPHRIAREPGGTPVGEAIRGLLLDHRDLAVPPETELLMMLAARAAFVREVVGPAVERGEVMVADRFELSTFVYQGLARGLGLERVRELNAFATGGRAPDLTLVLDLPVSEGRARQRAGGKAGDRIEEEGEGFLEEVAAGYRELAAADPRCELLSASASASEVHERALALLAARFPEPFGPSAG